jgi:hypothetical protein
VPAVGLERASVLHEPVVDPLLAVVDERGFRELAHRHDERRVARDADLVVDALGELRERLEVVLALGLRHRLLEAPHLLGCEPTAGAVDDRLRVDARVPELEIALRSELGHRLAIRADGHACDRVDVLLRELQGAAGEREARGEALHIPLEGAGVRLVEVVHVEDDRPVRRGEPAEVGEVGVAVGFHLES